MTTRNPFIGFVALVLATTCFAGPRSSPQALKQDYNDFLARMGFEDYSAQIAHNRELKSGIAPTSDAVLAVAQARYDVFNSARDLASALVSRLAADPSNQDLRHRLTDFTADMLRLKPVAPEKPIPKEIVSIGNEEEREKRLYDFAAKEETEILKKHISQVAASALNLLGVDAATVIQIGNAQEQHLPLTPEQAKTADLIRKVSMDVGHLVSFAYIDAEMGQTKYFGRALTLSMTKLARETKDPALESELKEAASQRGVRIENFVGNTHVAMNEKGKPVPIRIDNGALLLERSEGPEAGRLIAGSRPPWSRTWAAIKQNLWGHWTATVVPPGDDFSTNKPGLASRLRRSIGDKSYFTRGFSHVGMANVLTDEKLGISHVLVLDNYPHNNGAAGGGIRVIGLEQFALPGPYIRLGVKNMDAKAWIEHAKATPFTEVVWPAYEYGPDGYKEDLRPIPEKKGTFVGWKADSDAKQMYDKIQNAKPGDEKAIYAEVTKKATDHMRGDMLTRQGIGFNDSYGYCRLGWAFCTQSVDLAYSQVTGVGVQEIHDRWDIIPKTADRLGLALAKPLEVRDPRGRTMAPGGLIWGTPEGETTQVNYPKQTALGRAGAHFGPMHQSDGFKVQTLQAALERQGVLVPLSQITNNGAVEWTTINGRNESEALLGVIERSVFGSQEADSLSRYAAGKPAKMGIGCVGDYLKLRAGEMK